ncbi:MAG: CHASE2 domain-containing protein [Candidatus Omnitrophota bacterium]
MMKNFNNARIVTFLLTSFLVMLLIAFSYSRVFDEFEYITLDLRYKIRPPLKVQDDIVIVHIGDDSINKLEKWPFPRNYHALVIKALSSHGAKTIVFDVFFSEKKEGDEALAGAIKDAGNVYLPYVFELEPYNPDKTRVHAWKYAAPLVEILMDACKGAGFINVIPDEDGNLREFPAFIEYEGKLYPHLTLLAAINDLGYSFEQVKIVPEKEIVLNKDFKIPLAERSEVLINYPAVWGKAFRHYSYVDIMQSYLADITGQEPTLDLDEFKDSVCFVGLTATATPDTHPSPLEPLYPGVGVHASIYNSIMQKKFLVRLNKWWNLLILLIMCFLTGLITKKVQRRFAPLSVFLLLTSFAAFSMFFCWSLGVWVDVFYPIFAMVMVYVVLTFRKYLAEIQKRELLESELNIATDIQQSFLPQEIPQVGVLDVDVSMITARQVGGDLYDIVKLDNDKLGVMIGDVSGKGVPAALFMARVVTQFKIFFKRGSTSVVLKAINKQLCLEGGSNLFVTLTYMVLDTEKNSLNIAIGGHLPTIVVKPDGEVGLIDVEEGLPLGLLEGNFSEGVMDYLPGSTFIMYTDGVTEAMNVKGEMFGQERLVELAKRLKGKSAKETVEAIQQEVSRFAGKAPQHDDITVIAIKT